MILDEIVANKRLELERVKAYTTIAELEKRTLLARPLRDFASALTVRPAPKAVRIIAEVKRASPSKGILREEFIPYDIARSYEVGGAAAVSVVTEEKYFKGKLDFLTPIKSHLRIPILRKDFIFDDFQMYESRAAGADAVLLIAAILDDKRLKELMALAAQLGMQTLVEVHDETEMKRVVDSGAKIIGINNRDLRTFEVDLNTTLRLAPLVGAGTLIVSESGIESYADILDLMDAGVNAVLIGEALIREKEIIKKVKELRGILPPK
ncbi:MAG: indole-3-glycerol phosphate synthase TrpC [Deltaproteobacteria bacterium]|nr:indole-3-glycerol phosphate synthase TrpC [Deltaproteobacteria bacterium]